MASSKNFVFVHGLCNGAWIWHRLKPLLEAAGHRATALDMAASGSDPRKIQEIGSISEYSQPLLDHVASLSTNEKVLLVGHSFGGYSLALAMERFPEKISAAVFVTAFLPDTVHEPLHTLNEHGERIPKDVWMDSQNEPFGSTEDPSIAVSVGPNFLASKVFQRSPIEDIELAQTKSRPGTLFIKDLSQMKKFSKEAYGSIPRIYIVCKDDLLIPEFFQRWMIENSGATEVIELEGADHVPMCSKPQQLCDSLLEMAKKYP